MSGTVEGRAYYSPNDFEYGLRCLACSRLFVDGDEIRERLADVPFIETEIGEAFSVELVCVRCDEKEEP